MSAGVGLTKDQLKMQPLAGSLFVLKNIGYKGMAAYKFENYIIIRVRKKVCDA
jgi:hypothetical protein